MENMLCSLIKCAHTGFLAVVWGEVRQNPLMQRLQQRWSREPTGPAGTTLGLCHGGRVISAHPQL